MAEGDPVRILDKVAHVACGIVGAEYAALGILDASGESLVHHRAYRPASDPRTPSPPAFRTGILATILAERRARRLEGPPTEPAALGLPPDHPLVRSFLGVPIATSASPIGWLYVANKRGAAGFSDEDERLAATLAVQLGARLENVRLLELGRLRERALESEIVERKRAERALIERARVAALTGDVGLALAQGDTLGEVLQRCAELIVRHLGAAFARVWTLNEKKDVLELDASAGLYTHLDGAHGRVPVGEGEIGRIAAERAPHVTNDVEHDPLFRDPAWARREGLTAFAGHPLLVGGELVGVLAIFAREPLSHAAAKGLGAVADAIAVGVRRKTVETAQGALETQLRQAQKMDAIGRLAGGIAHDFDNLLTAIAGYCDLLLMRLEEGNRARQDIEEIRKAAFRAASLTRQLLAFSRKQTLEPTALELNEIVRNMEKLLRRLIGEDVELAARLDPALGIMKSDAGQVEQIIMNLAVNARDAMPHGGKLTIETANVEVDDEYASKHAEVRPGSYVMLAVSDNGSGMTAEVQSHLFEPFFTTKDPGKGTGLGLATVYGIAKQSGGHVTVYSEPGHGSTFKVYFPLAQEAAERAEPKPAAAPLPSGSETILLVEDEEVVRELGRRILDMHGYRVLAARNGREALAICEAHGDSIAALVTDVIMPEMSGRALAERLAERWPGVRVLYLSGYTSGAIAQHGVLEPGVEFLQKPFSPAALARRVREVLDAP